MKFQISHHKLMIENGRYVQTVGNSFTREGAALFCYLVTLLDQLVVANIRERVYFGQQILAWLLVHQTQKLSRIKFAHISRQVDGL